MSKHLSIFLICLLLIILGFIHFRGIFYPDEGYILNTAQRILQGQILYKDFDFVYTPFTPLLSIFGFLIFGERILSARIVAFSISFVTIIALYILSYRLTKNTGISVATSLIYLSWGPMHINFIWPSITAASIGILSIFLYIQGVQKKSLLWIFFSGVTAFLVFMTKQNLGLSVIAAFVVYFCVGKDSRKVTHFFYGLGISACIFFVYLLTTGSIYAFIKNFYENLILKIIIEGTLNTQILYDSSLYSYAKLLFYLSPLILAFLAIILCIKKKSELLLLPLFVAFFYLAGFRPVTDYVHLSPLIATSSLSLIPIFLYIKNVPMRIATYTYAALILLTGLLSPFFLGYYRWEPNIYSHHVYSSHPRVNIWIPPQHASEIDQLNTTIHAMVTTNQDVFFNYYSPMIYFILNVQNPTAYDYISGVGITKEAQKNVIETLNHKNVTIVLTHYLAENADTPIDTYIRRQYVPYKHIGAITVWKKK